MKKLIFVTKSKLAFNLLRMLLADRELIACFDKSDLTPTLLQKKNQIFIFDDTFLDHQESLDDARLAQFAQNLPTTCKKIALLGPNHAWQKNPPANLEFAAILTKPILAQDLLNCLKDL